MTARSTADRIDDVELVAVQLDGTPAKHIGPLNPDVTQSCVATAAHYCRAGFVPPWISYLAVADSVVLGICAFVAAPSDNRVEIAYHTFAAFEGRGAATAMVKKLIAAARGCIPAIELFAHTSAEQNASNTLLRKLGFQFAGTFEDREEGTVWEWRLTPI